MARVICVLFFVAFVQYAFTLSDGEDEKVRQDEIGMQSRAVDTYKITRFTNDITNKTTQVCDRKTRAVYTVQIAGFKADADGREYFGHVVSSEYDACFTSPATTTQKTIKQCLEHAANNRAVSFNYDKATMSCKLYNNWREHKFRWCKRGSNEKMYYLQKDRPLDHKPCTGVDMALSAAFTNTGSVTVTAKFNNAPCVCDVDRIEYRFLGMSFEMLIPEYTYTYTAAQANNWKNTTLVRAWAEGQIVAENPNYVPDNDL